LAPLPFALKNELPRLWQRTQRVGDKFFEGYFGHTQMKKKKGYRKTRSLSRD
jgi:hypothetical protein